MEPRIGDKGQRYEVRFIGSDGKEYVAGWTDDSEGKSFVESINMHPVWHSPRVIDRENQYEREFYNPHIGQRVTLNHLLHPGEYPGEIIDIDILGHCTVKLDRQDEPVKGVVYYDEKPIEAVGWAWQICYPIGED